MDEIAQRFAVAQFPRQSLKKRERERGGIAKEIEREQYKK
jgi:hypothetical protein